VEFRLLGPVEIRAAGKQAAAGHARQRSVLAVLLLDLGRVVSTERLIDRVWGDEPPAAVRSSLYGYVSKLKTAIADVGEPGVALTRRPGGYLLAAETGQVDLFRFRRQVAEAGAAAGDDERAAELLRGALGLWRGTALAGLSSPWLSEMRDTLELQRMAAVLDLNDIALRQGRHGAMVSELTAEAAAHPADERVIGQLMLALYRCGRQADALRWFEQTRQWLADEFGADPGPGLRALHQQILRADLCLALPESGGSSGRARPVPRELPMDVTAFTGRAAELAELDRLMAVGTANTSGAADTGEPKAAVVISAVSGTAGVGKTALAVHWAHRVADQFPDGQLYVNLRGYDPGQPMTAADALAGFLHALGAAGPDIPAGDDERAAQYRSLLAGRRMLVLVDNASDVGQVRPLLPGAPACGVLVTSRDSLVGLVARDGARRLDLDLLPPAEAAELLHALIGARVDADFAAATALAAWCSQLPLALRIAAELAAARPDTPLATLAEELADRQRLDLLDAGGDPHTAVRAVFSWSCRRLEPEAVRAFALAGLHPGPDLGPYAAAALVGSTAERAGHLLGVLARAHLIQPAGPGRYRMHDLLRAYARELAAAHHGDEGDEDAQDERRAALTRLFDHYLHTAAAAMDAVFPAERHRRPRVPEPAIPGPPMGDAAVGWTWLNTERASLAAAAAHAAANGWPGHATRLAGTLFRYLETGGYYPDAITIHTCARRAAREVGDRAAEAIALHYLGAVDARQGRYQQATELFQQALALFRDTGHLAGEARALVSLGRIDLEQGSYQRAATQFQQGLALLRQTDDRAGEAQALVSLGKTDMRLGDHPRAADHHRQALALFRETGDRAGQATALQHLGAVDARQGNYQQALTLFQQALSLFRETGHLAGKAYTLTSLGGVDLRQGDHSRAADHHRQALALFRETGDRAGEAEALNGLGEACLATGRAGHAREQHAAALDLASQIGERYWQARAHEGLARTDHAACDGDQARHHWQQALALYASLGVPEADQVRSVLATDTN
jgi:DNA-binding SARP family transcriptional activator/tetratricopeptide (TPR) repeat protein